jgi:hypothetical protein
MIVPKEKEQVVYVKLNLTNCARAHMIYSRSPCTLYIYNVENMKLLSSQL